MLVAGRLRHIAGTKWGSRKYLDISLLKRQEIISGIPPPGGRPQGQALRG
jgi:hypothetical protein